MRTSFETGRGADTMGEAGSTTLWKALAFAAVLECATAIALLVVPTLVVSLLLGVEIAGITVTVARCIGIALLGLALACWPGRQAAVAGSPPFIGMLTYSALMALYLAYCGAIAQLGGLMLWPAVALHAAVALLLLAIWRNG